MPRIRHWTRSGFESSMRCQPRRPTSRGSKTSNEKDVLVCERISGSIACDASPARGSWPVNTARPRAAETPQRKAAEAMKKYPRTGWIRLEVKGFSFPAPHLMMGPDREAGQGARRSEEHTSELQS